MTDTLALDYQGSRRRTRSRKEREAERAGMSTRRARRFALRVEVDGRMVAAHLPGDYHGRNSTYTNHGCRCHECSEANARQSKRCRERNIEDDQRWQRNIEEYEFMRSFGMSQQRACERIGVTYDALCKAANRRGYQLP